ncbi:hypothetical protein ACWF9X_16040 [Streptomyces globisporus]
MSASMSHRLGTAVTWSKASTVDGHAVLVLDRTPIRLAGPLAHLLLGLHVITAQQWRRRATTDWSAYLEAAEPEHNLPIDDGAGQPGATRTPLST